MEAIPNSSVGPRSVRLPFRVLAAFILVASLLAFGVSIAAKLGIAARLGYSPVQQLRDLIFLPGEAWLCRVCFYAAVHGRSPTASESWPFASSRVFGIYVCVLLFCL